MRAPIGVDSMWSQEHYYHFEDANMNDWKRTTTSPAHGSEGSGRPTLQRDVPVDTIQRWGRSRAGRKGFLTIDRGRAAVKQGRRSSLPDPRGRNRSSQLASEHVLNLARRMRSDAKQADKTSSLLPVDSSTPACSLGGVFTAFAISIFAFLEQ